MLLALSALVLAPACNEQGFHEIPDDEGAIDEILVEPPSIDFGSLDLDQVATASFVVKNVGETSDTIQTIVVSGAGTFSIVGATFPTALPAGQEVAFDVVFTAAVPGEQEALAHISLAEAAPEVVSLFGDAATNEPETRTAPPRGPDPVYEPAEEPIYAHSPHTLYTVDPATGDHDVVGTFHLAGGGSTELYDIAIDPAGRMAGGAQGTLYWVDPLSGELTEACQLSVGYTALTFSADGTLYSGSANDVVRIDPDTCTVDYLVHGASVTTSGDLVGLPDGYLYWTVRGGMYDHLVRIDPGTGSVHNVGSLDAGSVYGLSYFEDTLYAFGYGGTIHAVEPSDASTISVVTNTPSWYGAATNIFAW